MCWVVRVDVSDWYFFVTVERMHIPIHLIPSVTVLCDTRFRMTSACIQAAARYMVEVLEAQHAILLVRGFALVVVSSLPYPVSCYYRCKLSAQQE